MGYSSCSHRHPYEWYYTLCNNYNDYEGKIWFIMSGQENTRNQLDVQKFIFKHIVFYYAPHPWKVRRSLIQSLSTIEGYWLGRAIVSFWKIEEKLLNFSFVVKRALFPIRLTFFQKSVYICVSKYLRSVGNLLIIRWKMKHLI